MLKKRTVLAEVRELRAKFFGSGVHQVANIVATIEAACSGEGDDIQPVFEKIVESELGKLRGLIYENKRRW